MNYVVACYAIFLATGYTLQPKSVKADTLQKYLYDAKTLIQKFDLKKGMQQLTKLQTKLPLVSPK